MALIPELSTQTQGRYAPATPSLGAAMAPAEGLQRAGRGLASAGQQVGDLAMRFQEAQDQGVKSSARLAMQQAFAEHQKYRMENPDESTWEADMAQRIGKVRENVFKQRMSPFMKTELDSTFQGWAQTAQSDVMLDKTRQTVTRGRTAAMNDVRALKEAGRHDEAAQRLREVEGSLFLPEEVEAEIQEVDKDAKNWQRKEAIQQEENRINADPFTAWKDYESPEPPASADPEIYHRLRDHALRTRAREQAITVNTLSDAMAARDPEISGPEYFDQFKDELGDELVGKLKDTLRDRDNTALRKEWAKPENQVRMIGEIGSKIDGIDPNDVDAQYEAQMLLERLNEGPTKSALRKRLTDRIEGRPPETTALSIATETAQSAFKNRYFHDAAAPQPMPTATAVDRGFLKDKAKLATWFSEEQIAEINAPRVLKDGERPPTNAERVDRFRRLWAFRANKEGVAADPFDQATAEAIANRAEKIGYRTPEEKNAAARADWNAQIKLGKVLDGLNRWAAANPDKAKDSEAVRKELTRLAGGEDDEDFIKAAFPEDAALMDGGVLYGRDEPLPEPIDPSELPPLND